MVQENGSVLQYVKDQFITDEICKLAVQQYGNTLQCIKVQTEEICKLAVKRISYALKYVKDMAIKEKIYNQLKSKKFLDKTKFFLL
jgi:hypothetical protein